MLALCAVCDIYCLFACCLFVCLLILMAFIFVAYYNFDWVQCIFMTMGAPIGQNLHK